MCEIVWSVYQILYAKFNFNMFFSYYLFDLLMSRIICFSLSECYFAVKGAAVILPQPESIMSAAANPKTASTSGGE